ncbi:hypothetical protein [Larkinella terrae]|uniref:Uncharacterized protein n=1 Tax=Larkinella terrae TaxID=2025311 RepID=A0A7K0EK16_9BACT|nr:hypothetical protein [Larkinella terrae]MRS61816.1 hypothetical protein [Larkinella terrae]
MKSECTVAKHLDAFLSPAGALYVADPSNASQYTKYTSVADYNRRTRNWEVVSASVAKADFGKAVVIGPGLKVEEWQKE